MAIGTGRTKSSGIVRRVISGVGHERDCNGYCSAAEAGKRSNTTAVSESTGYVYHTRDIVYT